MTPDFCAFCWASKGCSAPLFDNSQAKAAFDVQSRQRVSACCHDTFDSSKMNSWFLRGRRRWPGSVGSSSETHNSISKQFSLRASRKRRRKRGGGRVVRNCRGHGRIVKKRSLALRVPAYANELRSGNGRGGEACVVISEASGKSATTW